PKQVDKQLVAQAEESAFYRPFTHFNRNIVAEDQQRLKSAAKQAIERDVLPAYQKFKQFLETEYLPACYGNVGCWQQTGGAAVYAAACRFHTTTDLSPDEIHEIGLREVERI